MLTLYEHPFALYCQKVLVALNELGVAYDVLEEQRDFDRAELGDQKPLLDPRLEPQPDRDQRGAA